uniref:HNH endonuclease family protein n=1 Tax=Streptomyces sp. F8 TaxID=1436085 RepID=UPI0003D8AC41|nr:HNH endonuclease family protein [Streptomyces sp. F8]AHE39807.1 Hypothetical protein pFRL5_144 [Streptomyces sp. F8]
MAPRLLTAGLVLAGALAASACGPLTAPGSRLNYANDPANLVAADGPTNAAKGAKNASVWMPPRAEAHCWYATAQVRVKTKYRLSVTPAEKAALRTALESCPAEAARR